MERSPTHRSGHRDVPDVRVLVVDSNKTLRDALCELIRHLPGMTCVGAAETGAEALLLTRATCPDTILVDSPLADMAAPEVIRRTRDAHPSVRIIGYSMQPGDGVEEAFREAGADGFVDKGGGIEELVRTILALGAVEEPARSDCDSRSRVSRQSRGAD